MKKIAFIIDSSSFSSNSTLSENFYLINLPINDLTEKKEYSKYDDLSYDKLDQLLVQNHILKTSSFPLGEANDLLKKLSKEYEKVLIMGISSKLSSSYNSWKLLLEDYDKNQFYLLDNFILGEKLLFFLKNFEQKYKEQANFDLLLQELKQKSENFSGLLCLKNIQSLINGGRVSSFKGLISKTFNLKFLIEYKNGSLDLYKKHMSYKSFFKSIMHYLENELKIDLNQPQELILWAKFSDDKYKEMVINHLKEMLPKTTFLVNNPPKPIMVHVGSNAFAILKKN